MRGRAEAARRGVGENARVSGSRGD